MLPCSYIYCGVINPKFLRNNRSYMSTQHLSQASLVQLLAKDMAATVHWSTQATQTRALTSPRGADLPAESLPCASVRSKTHCMWRLETVRFLMFSQHSQGWNSALLEGWSYNSSLFYALYCIYSNTSLSSLSVLQQQWISTVRLVCVFACPLHFGHRSWKARCRNKLTFSMSCCGAGELLFSQPQLVAVRFSEVILLWRHWKDCYMCPRMLVVLNRRIHQCNRCLKRHESVSTQSIAEYCMYDVLCHAQSEISFLKWLYVECHAACADLLCCVRCNHSNLQSMKCSLHWGWDCSLTSMLWHGFYSTRGYV